MCEHFQSTLDKLMEMEKEPLAVGDYTVHLNTELSMVDGKMVDIMYGRFRIILPLLQHIQK